MRLTRQLLTESLLLSLLGGIAGLAILFCARGSLMRLVPDSLPRLNDVSINWGVLLFALAASFAAGLIFGLEPALDQISTICVTHFCVIQKCVMNNPFEFGRELGTEELVDRADEVAAVVQTIRQLRASSFPKLVRFYQSMLAWSSIIRPSPMLQPILNVLYCPFSEATPNCCHRCKGPGHSRAAG